MSSSEQVATPLLRYFDEIRGGHKFSRVKAVVATHAHDDHIAGIADIVERCETAGFVVPDATSREEFRTLLEADSEMAGMFDPPPLDQYRRVFDYPR
ncbi:MAG: MBL fold metallo-hydrolase [Nocardioidaceae bacterium]